ncbi:eukaryotic translation termination factor 1 [Danaus plexippus plexippus]|uniref:Eukaryotic translation termination factor 1 n=1 Tax=Danaus plexippus plexippus TaxID=278856 RepID=A0A212EHP0_DANPL|nr:eukaryotic translation termination factor 1 [Danaus plexippus plexippus]
MTRRQLAVNLARAVQPLCVLESDFGFKINCAFKKSGLFRVRNLGGVKAHASIGEDDTGKYCFGVDDTLRALELGAVETLICWENLDIQRYVLKSHATSQETILHLTPEQEKDKSHFTDKDVSRLDLI